MPEGQLCVACSGTADILCDQCGPLAFLCKECFSNRHENTNIFHVPKEWKVSYTLILFYKPYPLPTATRGKNLINLISHWPRAQALY